MGHWSSSGTSSPRARAPERPQNNELPLTRSALSYASPGPPGERTSKNPYARRLKKQITIRLDEPTIEYFKGVAELYGVPYQTLINLYLRDCARKARKLPMDWRASA